MYLLMHLPLHIQRSIRIPSVPKSHLAQQQQRCSHRKETELVWTDFNESKESSVSTDLELQLKQRRQLIFFFFFFFASDSGGSPFSLPFRLAAIEDLLELFQISVEILRESFERLQ